MVKDQMFYQMTQAALARLADRDPEEIARNAGVTYNRASQEFHVPTLGTEAMIRYPDFSVTPFLPDWHRLVILHYLDLADGTPLTGREISFGQMKSGLIRGSGIDRKCELTFQAYPNLNAERLSALCKALGGQWISSNADGAFRIPFLPRFPITLKIWLPDEDFPASGRMFADASADHYLTIEDAVTVAELLLEKISPILQI